MEWPGGCQEIVAADTVRLSCPARRKQL